MRRAKRRMLLQQLESKRAEINAYLRDITTKREQLVQHGEIIRSGSAARKLPRDPDQSLDVEQARKAVESDEKRLAALREINRRARLLKVPVHEGLIKRREDYERWQRPVYDRCRKIVEDLIDEVLDKHVLRMMAPEATVSAYEELLQQAQDNQIAWTIYKDIVEAVITEAIVGIWKEIHAVRALARALSRQTILSAVQSDSGIDRTDRLLDSTFDAMRSKRAQGNLDIMNHQLPIKMSSSSSPSVLGKHEEVLPDKDYQLRKQAPQLKRRQTVATRPLPKPPVRLSTLSSVVTLLHATSAKVNRVDSVVASNSGSRLALCCNDKPSITVAQLNRQSLNVIGRVDLTSGAAIADAAWSLRDQELLVLDLKGNVYEISVRLNRVRLRQTYPSLSFVISKGLLHDAKLTAQRPTSIAYYPSLLPNGEQGSFLVGFVNGDVWKCNRAPTRPHRHLSLSHHARIVLLGHYRRHSRSLSLDADGVLNQWTYTASAISGFGWFGPVNSTQLKLWRPVHQALPTASSENLFDASAAGSKGNSVGSILSRMKESGYDSSPFFTSADGNTTCEYYKPSVPAASPTQAIYRIRRHKKNIVKVTRRPYELVEQISTRLLACTFSAWTEDLWVLALFEQDKIDPPTIGLFQITLPMAASNATPFAISVTQEQADLLRSIDYDRLKDCVSLSMTGASLTTGTDYLAVTCFGSTTVLSVDELTPVKLDSTQLPTTDLHFICNHDDLLALSTNKKGKAQLHSLGLTADFAPGQALMKSTPKEIPPRLLAGALRATENQLKKTIGRDVAQSVIQEAIERAIRLSSESRV
eukprot:TRINITY_DN12230_c0_g2_i30.p1 TRINITY_DN12230_c0_g2~~TRINITY_DN12230_c0_g2_i30.p1  ORF type:complete len:813 (+),score=112.03 TRINITY_DN12230_c0_g2_i30:265-2703(+)